MILSFDQVRQQIDDAIIRAITVDTCIFDGQKRGLEHGLLKRLEQFQGTNVELVFSEVVVRELEAHLTKDAENAQAAIRKAVKDAVIPLQFDVDRSKSILELALADENAAETAKRRLDAFVTATGATVLSANERVSIADLLDRYFITLPPFANRESKKNEFPDAIALLTLEAWANSRGTNIAVVTQDGDWKAYCERSARLIPISSLADALACFQKQAAGYLSRALEQKFREGDSLNLTALVNQALIDEGWKIEFDYDAHSQFRFDEDFVEGYYELIDIAEFEPVDFGENQLVIRAIAKVSADVHLTFTFEKWDGIDKEYMSMGSGTVAVEDEIDIEILITFSGNLPDRVTVENIEVLEQRIGIEVGEIEPDWMSDPDGCAN